MFCQSSCSVIVVWCVLFLPVTDGSTCLNSISSNDVAQASHRYKQMMFPDVSSDDWFINTYDVLISTKSKNRNFHVLGRGEDFIKAYISRKPIYKFNGLFVPRFVYNHNVLLLDFFIPPDTKEFLFTFAAYDNNLDGRSCNPKNIEMIVKPHGFPISNITLPEKFVNNDEEHETLTFQSDVLPRFIQVENPVAGHWFVRVFQSWTNPNDDVMQADGMSGSCGTFLQGRVDANILNEINVVSCSSGIQIELRHTENTTSDHYKCFITAETPKYSVPLTVTTTSQDIKQALIKFQGKRLNDPNKKSQFECLLQIGDGQSNQITMTFSPFVHEWHYLEVTYGHQFTHTSPAVMGCETFPNNPPSGTLNKIDLVRAAGYELFNFEYILPYNMKTVTVFSNNPQTLKFPIFQTKDIGGVLSLEVSVAESQEVSEVLVCIQRDKVSFPNGDGSCRSDSTTKPPDLVIKSNDSTALHFPYPETGMWFLTLGASCGNASDARPCSVLVSITISSSACFKSGCGRFGSCQVLQSSNVAYSSCRCFGGYTGWLCTDDAHVHSFAESLTNILLLTLSNLFFILSVTFAIRRKFYTEAVVYGFTMFFSIFYHACDSTTVHHGLCISNYGVLQFSDFFCAIFSIWVTLVAMTALNKILVSLLHVIGAIGIAFLTELNRFSMYLFIVPGVVGGVLVILAWLYHCKNTRKLFPKKKYLIIFLPAGLLMAGGGLMAFGFFQTNNNYHIVHSLWHVLVALSVLLLLPTQKYFYTDQYIEKISDIPLNPVFSTASGTAAGPREVA